MPETTNLDDLPVAPTTQTEGNIQLVTTEKNVKVDSTINNLHEAREADLEQNNKLSGGTVVGNHNMNDFVTGVQEAVAAGALGLQSRDIPQSQTHLTQDAQMKPNFVPTKENVDYIGLQQSPQEIVNENTKKKNKDENMDIIYSNLQTPLLLAVLYFLFQMPIVKQTTLRFMPAMFRKDGNPNLYGYLVNSASFAGTYYTLMLTLQYLSV